MRRRRTYRRFGEPRFRIAAVLIALGVCAVIAAFAVVPALRATAAVGDRPAWVQRFDRPVAAGAVTRSGGFPGYRDVRAAPTGSGRTADYSPTTVNRVENGELIWRIPGDGTGSAVRVGPPATGGEWSVRLRTDQIAGLQIADLKVPTGSGDRDLPRGTVAFPTGLAADSAPSAAVVTRNGVRTLHGGGTRSWRTWHTYTTQVVPGRSVRVLQDGIEVARTTSAVSRAALREQIRVSSPDGASGSGSVRVSAVAYSPRLDLGTIDAVGGHRDTRAGSPATPAARQSRPGPTAPSTSPVPSGPAPTPDGTATTTPGPVNPTAAPPVPASPPASSPSPPPSAAPAPQPVVPASGVPVGSLVFADEFDGSALDTTKWVSGQRAGGDVTDPLNEHETACWAARQLSFSGGQVHFTAQSAASAGIACGYPNVAAEINSSTRHVQSYGYFETRMRMPVAQGAWPVFWAWGRVWPDDLEFDVVEGTGSGSGCFNVHAAGGVSIAGTRCVGGLGNAFHTYGALVEPDGVTYYYDGREVGRWQGTVPDTGRGVYLGLQVSNWDQPGPLSAPITADADYVRVWNLRGQ